MKRLLAFRAFLAVQSLQTVDLAFNEPASRVWALQQAGGWAAKVGLAAMTVLAFAALLDLFIGDFGPRIADWLRNLGERYALAALLASQLLRKCRGMIWLLMAIGYASQVLVAVRYGFAPRVAGLYLTTAVACASVAWLDNHYRFEATKQRLRDTGHGELT